LPIKGSLPSKKISEVGACTFILINGGWGIWGEVVPIAPTLAAKARVVLLISCISFIMELYLEKTSIFGKEGSACMEEYGLRFYPHTLSSEWG